MRAIAKAVGFGGTNYATDVMTVQGLLSKVPPNKGGPVPFLVIDGICGPLTIAAIHQFQLVNIGSADDRVDPGGPTLKALNGYDAGQGRTSTTPAPLAVYDPGRRRQVAPISTTYVAMPDPKYYVGSAGASQKGVSDDLWSWFVGKLSALDKALKGSAKQSWGMIIWGEGTGKDSTATQLSKGGTILGFFDYAKFMKIMDLILDVVPEGTSYHKTLKNMHDACNAKDPEAFAGAIKEGVATVKEIQALSKTPRPPTPPPITPARVAFHKAEVGQWYAMDPLGSGNMYIMIEYSDGSKQFLFRSIYGGYDIRDPGDVGWKPVSE